MNYELVGQVRRAVAERLAARAADDEAAGRRSLDDDDRREYARQLIDEELERYQRAQLTLSRPPLDGAEEAEIAQAVYDALFGVGRLQPLLADPDIENVDINGADRVWLTRAGDSTPRPGPPIADSDEELVELLRLMAARIGLSERRFDAANPRLNLRLPDGSRLFALMAVSKRPVVSIRRHRFVRATLDELAALGMFDAQLRSFLAAAVRARKNIIVAGGTNAGKTTLLRALANEIPPTERIVTIEQSLELDLDELDDLHPNAIALEAREPNTEGAGAIGMADLVRAALRMNPARVIVGEVLGDEILSMLNAMSQGNDGSMCTIHATSSQYVFRRIATYAIQSAERLPVEATNLLIAGAINFVVFIGQQDHSGRGGTHERYIASVREVLDADGRLVVSNEIFQPDPATGRAVFAVEPRCLPDLLAYGYDPDTGWRAGRMAGRVGAADSDGRADGGWFR